MGKCEFWQGSDVKVLPCDYSQITHFVCNTNLNVRLHDMFWDLAAKMCWNFLSPTHPFGFFHTIALSIHLSNFKFHITFATAKLYSSHTCPFIRLNYFNGIKLLMSIWTICTLLLPMFNLTCSYIVSGYITIYMCVRFCYTIQFDLLLQHIECKPSWMHSPSI